jgi:hypothetical protein
MTLMLCFFSLRSCLSETYSSAGSNFVVWLTTALYVRTYARLSGCPLFKLPDVVGTAVHDIPSHRRLYVPASSPRLSYSPAPRRESATTSMAVQWAVEQILTYIRLAIVSRPSRRSLSLSRYEPYQLAQVPNHGP